MLAGIPIVVLGVIFRHSVSGFWAGLFRKNRQRKQVLAYGYHEHPIMERTPRSAGHGFFGYRVFTRFISSAANTYTVWSGS